MPVYHIVLLKVKEGVTDAQHAEWKADCEGMMGKVPGLLKVDIGPPLAHSAARGKGYTRALVAVLDKPESLPVYAAHPEHVKLFRYRDELCEDTLAYDMICK